MLSKEKRHLTVRETVVFAMLGSIMFASKLLMEILPNIHLVGVLTLTYTLVYRKKALIPIYIFVVINGIYAGFSLWWFPYTYIWTLLWGIAMLLPKNMRRSHARIVYPLLCAIHGLCYGILYSPAQALMYGMSFEATLAWVISGLPFDVIHAASNFAFGFLILPLEKTIRKIDKTNQ